MILYLDTSALIKFYLDEPHSDSVHTWVRTADLLATSRVTLTEAAAAIGRHHRTSSISRKERDRVVEALLTDWPTYIAVELHERQAAVLAVERGLRGFDAIQLLAALTVKRGAGAEDLVFSSFDVALNRAARAEGLTVLEPLD